MDKCNVVIIDSGIELENEFFDSFNIYSYNLIEDKWISKYYKPKMDHGTSVASIILSGNKDKINNLSSFNIFIENMECEEDLLISALKYVYENIECDFINLSLGITTKNDELKSVCNKLINKGTSIIAAFDNEGAISYPAAYANVIGVDTSYMATKKYDFYYIEDSVVSIYAKGSSMRTLGFNGEYKFNTGTSFACACVTSFLVNNFKKSSNCKDSLRLLKGHSKGVLKVGDSINKYRNLMFDEVNLFKIKNVAIFPYNKETKSFLNFSEILSFRIEGFYDIHSTGKVGLSEKSYYSNATFYIESIENCRWENIDTFIMGHTKKLDYISKTDTRTYIVDKCIEHNINLFAFDDNFTDEQIERLNISNINWWIPNLRNELCLDSTLGKMFEINTPVVGIFGTSSQQGKFTSQLLLRNELENEGYKVGQLGSEPEAKLFGFDEVYPYGYEKVTTQHTTEMILYLNKIMHNIDEKNYDIIIVGSQSGTIPICNINSVYNTSDTLNFMLGTLPDAVILAVNIHDDIEYIQRTINVIESLIETKVIALSIFPLGFDSDWNIHINRKTLIEKDKIEIFRKQLQSQIGIETYILGEETYIAELTKNVISYFG